MYVTINAAVVMRLTVPQSASPLPSNMMFRTIAVVAVTALLSTVTAQTIDPDSVDIATRDTWCTSQITACPLICTQETNGSAAVYSNTCDPDTLDYSCVCDNGLSPNISEYSQTIPYFTCTESNNQCRTACGISNNACAAACVEDHPCGAQNPTRVNATTTATGTASATGTGASSTDDSTSVYSGFGSSASSTGSADSGSEGGNASSSSGAGRVLVNFGQIYGLGVVAAGIVTGFAILL